MRFERYQHVLFEGELFYIVAISKRYTDYAIKRVSDNKVRFVRGDNLTLFIGENRHMKKALQRIEDLLL